MSSETLENLEDGVTRLLDELKTTIYHHLSQLRGCTVTMRMYCQVVSRTAEAGIRSAERLSVEDANGYVSDYC